MYNIRPETPSDHKGIRQVNTSAFGQPDEATLVDRLRELPVFALSLVAVAPDETVIGHILFSKIEIVNDQEAVESLALAPMSVHPDHQNQGIGSALVQAGLARCREMRYEHVIVLGHPTYYPRFGFSPAANWGIQAPFPVSTEAFMALELLDGALKGVRGTVQYPAPFDEV